MIAKSIQFSRTGRLIECQQDWNRNESVAQPIPKIQGKLLLVKVKQKHWLKPVENKRLPGEERMLCPGVPTKWRQPVWSAALWQSLHTGTGSPHRNWKLQKVGAGDQSHSHICIGSLQKRESGDTTALIKRFLMHSVLSAQSQVSPGESSTWKLWVNFRQTSEPASVWNEPLNYQSLPASSWRTCLSLEIRATGTSRWQRRKRIKM